MLKVHNYNNRKINSQHQGFTMVELMVAMAIGLFLISGVFQLFVANKQSTRILNNLSHIQQNGRFAIDQITSILRIAGFKTDPLDTISFTVAGSITGIDGVGTAPDEVSISFQATPDGLITDCRGIPLVASVPATTVTNRFYIANDANGISNLFCDAPVTTPLVEDVANMQIVYGVDIDNSGTANFYVDAALVADWSQVIGVQLSLLLTSTDNNVATAAQTYVFNGATVTAGDNRLHKVFNTTVALRNLE